MMPVSSSVRPDLTDERLDVLVQRIPDRTPSPKGVRRPMDKRKAIQGVLWILDNGAKWKDPPQRAQKSGDA
jgi:transposase